MTSTYLTDDQVSQLYPGVSKTKLARWRWMHVGPAFTKMGRVVLYRAADIEAYLDGRRVAA